MKNILYASFVAILIAGCNVDVVTHSYYEALNTLTLPCKVRLVYNHDHTKDTVIDVAPGETGTIEMLYRNQGDNKFDEMEGIKKLYHSITLIVNDSMQSTKDLLDRKEWNFLKQDKNNGTYTLIIDTKDF